MKFDLIGNLIVAVSGGAFVRFDYMIDVSVDETERTEEFSFFEIPKNFTCYEIQKKLRCPGNSEKNLKNFAQIFLANLCGKDSILGSRLAQT